jgi:hypothetical protein
VVNLLFLIAKNECDCTQSDNCFKDVPVHLSSPVSSELWIELGRTIHSFIHSILPINGLDDVGSIPLNEIASLDSKVTSSKSLHFNCKFQCGKILNIIVILIRLE